jgi:hypothetical protein
MPVAKVRAQLMAELQPDGLTVGLNDGLAAGQTVDVGRLFVGRSMASKSVAEFKPSRNGLHFANAFTQGPVFSIPVPLFGAIRLGNAERGLCGGMVFTVLDLFTKNLPPPPDTEAPAPGTPFFKYLARRLLDSFNGPRGVLKYMAWMCFPDDEGSYADPKNISWHTVNREWPAIKQDLDNDCLCPLGLIKVKSINPLKLGVNHQVLAYGYNLAETTGDLRIWVYDPNCPGEDDVTLSLNVANPAAPSRISYSADPSGRGFFRTRFVPADPSAALAAI